MGRHMGTRTRDQRGFTLIELMIVVGVIAILAAIAIPSFFRQSSKVKASSEVTPMMAELAMKLDQYKVENGQYLAVAKCPTATSTTGTATSTCLSNADWVALRINPPQTTLRCTYEVAVGDGLTAAATPITGVTWSSPAMSWYYVIAECDSDGSGGTNAQFFMASNSTAVQKVNEGN